MSRLKRNLIFFVIGGFGYAALELLWRGWTHWSMVLAGGICFVLFSKIAERFEQKHLAYKALLCAVTVTAIELMFGVVFNIILNMNVWDYSMVPFNFMGQICLYYTLLWCLFGFLFIPVAERLNARLAKADGT